jgi:hypothetical protein
MEELQEADIKRRADELLAAWPNKPRAALRGLGGLVAPITHLAAYLLAIIYYSSAVARETKHIKDKIELSRKRQLWIDEAIDRVMQFAPLCNISEDECREDLTAVVSSLGDLLGDAEIIASPDLLSNKLFNSLQKHNSKVGERERGLVDYIVRAELMRLSLIARH